MNKAVLILFISSFGLPACGGSGGGGGDSSDGADDGQTDVVDTDEGNGSSSGDDGLKPDTKIPTTQEARWTLVTHVPADVAGKQIREFSGFIDENGARPYFCGDGGIFRINQGTRVTPSRWN
jgi:hypothetical protein